MGFNHVSRRRFLTAAAATAALPAASLARAVGAGQGTPKAPAKPIVPAKETVLFNGADLTGWYTFFPSKGVNRDPDRIVTVKDGVVAVTGKEFGYFATTADYADYHLSFEVRWGEKKWPPRENAVRDSGVLVHTVGPDRVWPTSFECQIQEKDYGDIFHLGGVSSVYGGKRRASRVIRTEDREKPHGEWNTVEVICAGDTVANVVNGAVVNFATGVALGRDGGGGPLAAGKIAFQSEGAEVYYRNIVLRPVR